jgi:hypothetical protein
LLCQMSMDLSQDFMPYIRILLNHHDEFEDNQWLAFLHTMTTTHIQRSEAMMQGCLEVLSALRGRFKIDLPLKEAGGQAIITVLAVFGNRDLLDKVYKMYPNTQLTFESDTGVTPLTSAIEYGNLGTVYWLLDKGVKPGYSRFHQQTHLDFAYRKLIHEYQQAEKSGVKPAPSLHRIFDLLFRVYCSMQMRTHDSDLFKADHQDSFIQALRVFWPQHLGRYLSMIGQGREQQLTSVMVFGQQGEEREGGPAAAQPAPASPRIP